MLLKNVPIDFEINGNGLNWTWTTFENDSNPPLEIVPNPDTSGINTSSTVAKFTALQVGEPWAGVESMHGTDIGSSSLNNANCTVKIMVWKSVISDVGIKFVDATNAAQPEIKVSNTLVNQWEELTFDFSSRIGVYPIVKDQIVIFPDFDLNGRTQDNIIYFDNVYGSVDNTDILGEENKKLFVYPNPVKDVVQISMQNIREPFEITVYDLIGNILYRSSNQNINMESFSKGIYLFEVNQGAFSQTIKIAKD